VRNGFGMAFDPVTGELWDTENGPTRMNEINLVLEGFNSGWNGLMGPVSEDPEGDDAGDLVGDSNTGSVYLFRLNGDRDGFVLSGDLADVVLDESDEGNPANLAAFLFGEDFGSVTDLRVGPDGAVHLLSLGNFSDGAGSVYRLVPEPGPAALVIAALAGPCRRRAAA